MDIQQIIAGNFKLARSQAGKSQEDVAKHLGLPRSAISDIETGKRRIAAGEMAALAALAGRSLDWFFEEHQDEGSFVVLARAQDSSPDVQDALRRAQLLCENYDLIESLLGS
jgi:transcriptional regulator with XRE-family HTH domain